jgi:hypothetical protein
MLIQFGDSDLDAERKRVEARKKRKLDKDAKEKTGETITTVETAAPTAGSTPATTSMPPPATTPGTSTPTGGTKRKKGEKGGKQAHFSDIAQHRAATSTAQLFTGGMAKKYSWMTSGTSSGATTPLRGGLSTGAGMADRLAAQTAAKKDANALATAAPREDPGLASKKSYKKLGLLKEVPFITLKDVLGVLERSGKEKRVLVRGYAKLDQEK